MLQARSHYANYNCHFVDLSLLTVSLSGWALVLRSFGLGGRMASAPPDGAGPIVPQKGSILNFLTRPTVPSNNSSPPTTDLQQAATLRPQSEDMMYAVRPSTKPHTWAPLYWYYILGRMEKRRRKLLGPSPT